MSKKTREFDSMEIKDEEGIIAYVYDKGKYSKRDVLFKTCEKLGTSIVGVGEGCAKYSVGAKDYILCECKDGGAFPVWIVMDCRGDVVEEVLDSLGKEKPIDLPKGATVKIISSDNNNDFVEIKGSFSGFKLKEPKFEVGDRVKPNEDAKKQDWYFSNTVMVVSIEEDNDVLLSNGELINAHWLDKVEEEPTVHDAPFPYSLQKGEEIQVSSSVDVSQSNVFEKFYAYDSDLEKPFLTIDINGDITNWKYAKPLPKYKAYTEPKLEWLKDNFFIYRKNGNQKVEITCINKKDSKGYLIELKEVPMMEPCDCGEYYLHEMVNFFNDENGNPFGELINEK